MLQLSIREFNKNISKAMKNLPVEITNRGKVFATIVSAEPQGSDGKGYKKVVFRETVKPNGVPMTAPAKTPVENWKVVTKKELADHVSKNAGERNSVVKTPTRSATPPPSTEEVDRALEKPFPDLKPIPKPNAETITIPKLRKKLCSKHSVFSCGCPEKKEKVGKL